MLPNLIYIGPDKGGSTWIWQTLAVHPEVSVSPAKDLYFFDRFYSRGLPWYARQFPERDSPIVVEVCHDYLYSPDAAARMARDLPGVRVFVSLREPIDRIISGYQNMVRNGETIVGLDDAVEAFPALVERSRYGKHLARYLEEFGPERVGIFEFDVLRSDPQLFFSELCEWIGIAPIVLSDEQLEPARVAEAPRVRWIARAAQVAARGLRRTGAVRLLSRVKHSSLGHRLLYEPLTPTERPVPSEELVARLRVVLRDDVQLLNAVTGTDYARLWGFR